MTKPIKMLFFLFTFLVATESFANNPGVSYQGRIFKPDGNALEGTSVQFRMQVRSPGSENCLLFEEVQTLNMAGSSGIFSITMNDGTGTRLDAATYQVDRIFANRDVMTLDTSRCATGTSYAPNVADGRKLIVYFKDETMSAYEAMPIMNLNYVPQAMYALEAQKVDKFAVNNILRAVDGSGNPVTAPALDPTQLTNLTNLLAGTSTQYATTTAFNTVQAFAKSAPPTCGAGEVLKSNGTSLSCVTDSAGGAPAYSAITAASATNTIDNTNFAQTWNWSTATTQSPMSMNANALTTGSLMSVATSSASLNSTSGLINVANTGASTSGILARFQSNSTAGSGLTILTNGNVGIGTSTPTSLLEVAGSSTLQDVTATNIALNQYPSGSSQISHYLTNSNTSGTKYLTYGQHIKQGVSATTATAYGGRYEAKWSTTANSPSATLIGFEGLVDYWTGYSSNVGTMIGLKGNVGTSGAFGAANVSSASAVIAKVSNTPTSGSSTITNAYGIHSSISSTTPANTTNGYGIYVGTIEAATKYSIYASDSTAPSYYAGNVGIGTASPKGILAIVGPSFSTAPGDLSTSAVNLISQGAAAGHMTQIALGAYSPALSYSPAAIGFVLTSTTAFQAGDLVFSARNVTTDTSPPERMRITGSGNVGIGTTSPQTALDVAGVIRVAKYAAQPFACDAAHDSSLAITSGYRQCICKGGTTAWVFTSDGATACTW